MKKIFSAALVIVLAFFATETIFAQVRDQSTAGWPPANILTQYGIAGIPQPTGATDLWWRVLPPDFGAYVINSLPTLYISMNGTSATGTAIRSWFDRNGWTLTDENRGVFTFSKGAAMAAYELRTSDGVGSIRAVVRPSISWPSTALGRFSLSGLSLPPGASLIEFEDDGDALYFTILGGKPAYDNLVNQFTRLMGAGQNDDGQLIFWNARTSVAVYIDQEIIADKVGFSIMQH